MIEIHNNFFTNEESEELIQYYLNNPDKVKWYGGYHNFYGIPLFEKTSENSYDDNGVQNFKFSSKLNSVSLHSVRIQKVNREHKCAATEHKHNTAWSAVIFLNDNFAGGNLNFENIRITPKKNQCVLFSGTEAHRVSELAGGDRYTLVLFLNSKLKVNNNLL